MPAVHRDLDHTGAGGADRLGDLRRLAPVELEGDSASNQRLGEEPIDHLGQRLTWRSPPHFDAESVQRAGGFRPARKHPGRPERGGQGFVPSPRGGGRHPAPDADTCVGDDVVGVMLDQP